MMRKESGNIACCIVLFLCFVLLAVDSTAQKNGQEMSMGKVEEGLSIFDHNQDGKRTWELHGVSAEFVEDGFVEIQELNVTIYPENPEDGNILISSPSAQINQATKVVRTEEPVSISSDEMDITGQGLEGNIGDKVVHLKQNVRVILKGDNANLFFSNSNPQPTEPENDDTTDNQKEQSS
ncbi:MAG: LPS export ABC transporter periplasmic protein LptC [Candidatus Auribacterota bacterium]